MAAVHAAGNSMVLSIAKHSGFPPRSLTRRRNGDQSVAASGEWITAYQANQTKQLRAVWSKLSVPSASSSHVLKPPVTTPISDALNVTLNRYFLLNHCCVDDPTDLCVCNISGAGLRKYQAEDFAVFDNVAYINASDNHLPMEAFENFPVLEDLELALNGIIDIALGHGEFTQLQCLDLSYNTISCMALLQLGALPSLKELHLTGNNIVALPVDMSRPVATPSGLGEGSDSKEVSYRIRFPVLEKLWLDDNKLTDLSTFATLAGLRRLKYLNLDENEIYHIPQLRLLGVSALKAAAGGNKGTEKDVDQPPLRDGEDPSSLDPVMQQQQPPEQPQTDTAQTQGQAAPPTSTSETTDNYHGQFNLAPFPALETLSLVNNLILNAEGLLACCDWPSIRKLVVYDNPIITSSNGMPQLLKEKLVEQHGIKVIRKKPTSRLRFKIAKAAKDFKKVSSAMPPLIPKYPLALALEPPPAPSKQFLDSPPNTPPSVCGSSEAEAATRISGLSTPDPGWPGGGGGDTSSSTKGRRKGKGMSYDDDDDIASNSAEEQVFMTQLSGDEDVCSSKRLRQTESEDAASSVSKAVQLPTVEEEFRAWKQGLKDKYKDVPQCYKGYEALLEDRHYGSTLPIPSDMQGCTRALQHALRHPLVVPDPKALRSANTRRYLKRREQQVVKTDHVNPKVREFKKLLNGIKSQTTTIELDLGTCEALAATPESSSALLVKESKKLLAEIQRRYDQVRASSLRVLQPLLEPPQSPSHGPSHTPLHSRHKRLAEQLQQLNSPSPPPTSP